MNDNDFTNENKNNNSYHATSNLNTAIENPQINMNSAVGVNIQDVGSNNYANLNQSDNQYSNDNSYDDVNDQNSYINDNQSYYTDVSSDNSYDYSSNTTSSLEFETVNDDSIYKPTMEEKKGSRFKISISREFKIILFIGLILFIFILLMPYLYDFLEKLKFSIMG